jgi:MarR family transcriptional regulator, transcriptional regulator for hemolysin
MNHHQLFHSVQQLSRQLTKHLNEALSPFGLYSAQWSVIYVLKVQGPMTQKEISDYLSVEAPPMTRTIQRLLKQGYVEQLPGEDKRTKVIHLTNTAHREYPTWEAAVMDINNKLLQSVPEASRKKLELLLTDWICNL